MKAEVHLRSAEAHLDDAKAQLASAETPPMSTDKTDELKPGPPLKAPPSPRERQPIQALLDSRKNQDQADRRWQQSLRTGLRRQRMGPKCGQGGGVQAAQRRTSSAGGCFQTLRG
jgi:hypothetical protein